jgi:hypothetical protein
MNRLSLWLAILAPAAAAACVSAGWPSDDSGLPHVPVEQCSAAGGTVMVAGGLAPAPMCVVPTPDANRPCTDSSQCVGRCIHDGGEADAIPRAGARATGRCEPDNASFGCFAEIRRGRATGAMCVD